MTSRDSRKLNVRIVCVSAIISGNSRSFEKNDKIIENKHKLD